MKTIIAAVVTCVMLFGASYAASVYFANAAEATEEESDTQDPAEEGLDILPEGESVTKVDLPMQVSNPSDRPVSIEAVMALSEDIHRKEARQKREKAILEANQKRLGMLEADLKQEQSRLRTMADTIDVKINQMKQMMDQLNGTLATIDERREELRKLEKSVGVDDQSKREELKGTVANVKSWFNGLPPQDASKMFKTLANNGKLDLAAELLQSMPDRDRSKIISSLDDWPLIEQLIDAAGPKAN